MSESVLVLSVKNYESFKKTVESARDLGIQANAAMNNIKVDSNIGKSFAEQITIVKTSTESLKKTIEDVKKTNDTATLKPTISRHWENEAASVTASVKKAENAIDGLKDKSYTAGQPLGFKIPDAAPTVKTSFADSYKSGFDDIDARLEKTRTSFQKLAQTRGDKGQFDNIYQGAFAAEKKVNDLTNRVRSLRKEAADPLNAKFAKNYTDGIREAEKELSRLESKQKSLSRSAGAAGGGRGRRGLGEGGRAVLEVVDDFVPAGLNKPFNAVVKEVAKIEGLSLGVLGAWTGIGIAAYAIIASSISIREEAKKRLKTEEAISVEYGKQNTAINDLIKNTQVERQTASLNRYFSGGGASLDELKARQKTLEELQRIETKYRAPTAELGSALKENDALIAAKQLENTRTADERFNQSFENRVKAQQLEIQAQEKAAQIFAKSVEDGKAKVKELGATFRETIGNLYEKANSQNPFVAVFTDADKALKTLRENLKGLPADMQNAAIGAQQRINRNALFSARLDNNLETFDLRERANSFRNAYDPAKAAKEREDIAKRYSDAGGVFQGIGGNLGSYLSKQAGGFDKLNPNQIRDIYETSLLNANSQYNNGNNQNGLISSLATQRLRDENQNLSVNERLQKQIGIIYGGAGTEDEKAIADRKLLSLSSNLNPNEIDSNLRDKIASAGEREADRREKSETAAIKLQTEQLETQKRIAANQEALLKIAEKEGIAGVKNFVEIVDKTDGAVKISGASPTNNDTRTYYQQYEDQK